jgi:hypothetical protein
LLISDFFAHWPDNALSVARVLRRHANVRFPPIADIRRGMVMSDVVTRRVRSAALIVTTLVGGAFGAFCGFVMSMWGGIQLFLPLMTALFAVAGYVACRMVLSVVEAFRS